MAPVLYMLGLIGVGAGILFSSYSQTLRTNITMTNNLGAKSDLDASATTLAATSVLGSDAYTLCPPQGGADTTGTNCANAPAKMIELAPTNAVGADAHLPAFGFGGGNNSWSYMRGTAVEVGIFTPGAGTKQLDPWGHYYIYCRWENTPTVTTPAIQIISAGSTGTLNTQCGTAAVSTTPDNYMISMDAANAVNRSAVWQTGTVGSSTPDVYYGTTGHQMTVDANGNVTIPGNLGVNGNYTSAAGNLTLTAGGVSAGGNVAAGGSVSGASGTFVGALSADNSSFLTGSGGTVSAVNGGFTVNSGGAVSAAGGNFMVGSGGNLSIGTSQFLVTAATGNTGIGGTLGVNGAVTLGSGLSVAGLTALGTTTVATGSSLPLLSVGKKIGLAYPFYVDQFGNVSGSAFSGSFNGPLTGTVTTSALTFQGGAAVTGDYTSSSGNITLTSGTVTAANFKGNINVGSSGGATITGVIPVANGGTGSSTATGALANLGVTSGGYLSTTLLTSGLIPGADIVSGSVTSTQLNSTGVGAGTYNTVQVGADGRVITGSYTPANPTTITDGQGESVVTGTTGITFTIGSTTQGYWTATGLDVGSSTPAKNKIDVQGGVAIGTQYAGTVTVPSNGLAVAGNVGIGTSAPVSALQVVGTITATNFSGSGAGLTNIGTGSISGTVGPGNGGTGTNTVFTQGSVVFAGASGVYSQDNANFFYNAATHSLGIDTAVPQSALSVNGGAAIGTFAGTAAAPTNGLIVSGRIGIGTTAPNSLLQAYGGEVQVGSSGAACSTANAGAIRFSTTTMYYCDGGGTWQAFLGGGGSGSGLLGVSQGGTGDSTLTAHAVLVGEGTAAVAAVGPGAVGTLLAGNGASADPSFSANLVYGGLETNSFGIDYTTVGAAQADVALGTSSTVRYAGSGASTFNGIAAGASGQVLRLHNASSAVLTLSNQSMLDATASSRIITGTGSDLQMAANSSVILQYDGTAARWRVIGGSGGGIPAGTTGQVQFNSGNNSFAADVNLTWDNTNKRIGIGTSTPVYTVDANAGTVAGTTLHVNADGFAVSTSMTSGGVALNTATPGQMAYYAGQNALAGTPNLNVVGSNIGVGTSVATQALTVAGYIDTTLGYSTEIANGGTATILNKLAKLSNTGLAAPLGTSDTTGAIGIVVGGAGATGNAQIAFAGQAPCVFDGSTTAGHYVGISTATAADCTDSGASAPSGQTIGRVLSTNASAGTYPVFLATGGGGSGGSSAAGPTAFSFTNQTGVAIGTTISSNFVTLSGFTGTLSASCVGCSSLGRNGSWGNTSPYAPGDTIGLQVTASNSLNSPVTATATVGGTTSTPWQVTTGSGTPNSFSFTAQTGVVQSATITSNAVTLAGTFTNLTATCGSGCTDIIHNGTDCAATTCSGFAPGDTIAIKQTSSSSVNTTTTAVVVLGSTTSGAWQVTTNTGTVSAFSFTNQTGVAPGTTVTSNAVTLAGSFAGVTATCGSGCTDIIHNGTDCAATTCGGFASGDTIAIKQIASSGYVTPTTAAVSVGSTASSAWQVTTNGVACTKTITTTLSEANPYAGSVSNISYSMIGGGAGGSAYYPNGGGGGSSAILTNSTLVQYAAGGSGVATAGAAGGNGTVASGTFALASGSTLKVYVGAGGGGAGAGGWPGGGGSGYFGGGGGTFSAPGGGGSNAGGTGFIAGSSLAGGKGQGDGAGGNSNGIGASGGNAGTGGARGDQSGGSGGYGGGGGGGYGAGGGSGGNSASAFSTAGASNGATATNGPASGGLGSNTWASSTTLPAAAGAGGSGTTNINGASSGGNGGLVILNYTAASACSL